MSDIFAIWGQVKDVELTVVPKGWGFERWLANGPLYCAKELILCKGRQCSYHYHEKKDETFLVVEGQVLMIYSTSLLPPPKTQAEIAEEYANTIRLVLYPGDVFHIPPLMRHRFNGQQHARILKVSTQHFEKDSFRIIHGD